MFVHAKYRRLFAVWSLQVKATIPELICLFVYLFFVIGISPCDVFFTVLIFFDLSFVWFFCFVLKDWYIVNKHSWGNPYYLIKILFCPYITLTTLVVITICVFSLNVSVENRDNERNGSNILHFNIGYNRIDDSGHSWAAYIANVFITICCIIVGIRNVFKTQLLNDIHGIRQEMKYEILLLFILLFEYSLFEILFLYWFDDSYKLLWLLYIILNQITITVLTLSTTYFPMYLVRKKIEKKLAKRANSLSLLSLKSETSNNNKNNDNNVNNHRRHHTKQHKTNKNRDKHSVDTEQQRKSKSKSKKKSKSKSQLIGKRPRTPSLRRAASSAAALIAGAHSNNETKANAVMRSMTLEKFLSISEGLMLFMQHLASELATGIN